METEYFIALDTHCSFSEMAVVTSRGKIVKRDRAETKIPELAGIIKEIRRPRYLTFEEGPLADWLARSLRPWVDKLVVCEPRRNRLIAKEGDKDDPIDAEKLAQLFRGGFLKEVHQTDSLDRAILKQQVSFYHDRVRERVRQGHQLTGQFRRHGIFASIAELADPDRRETFWRRLPRRKVLRDNLRRLLAVFELLLEQEGDLREELVRRARRESVVRRFAELPGVAWIRAVTFYVYIDTPWRFARKPALWRYCGIGLERRHSGRGPNNVRLAKSGNRRLKNVLIGAARSAADGADDPFAEKYRYWTQEKGMHPSTARRNVARGLAATLWSLWKSGDDYDPARVRGVGRPAGLEV